MQMCFIQREGHALLCVTGTLMHDMHLPTSEVVFLVTGKLKTTVLLGGA